MDFKSCSLAGSEAGKVFFKNMQILKMCGFLNYSQSQRCHVFCKTDSVNREINPQRVMELVEQLDKFFFLKLENEHYEKL